MKGHENNRFLSAPPLNESKMRIGFIPVFKKHIETMKTKESMKLKILAKLKHFMKNNSSVDVSKDDEP